MSAVKKKTAFIVAGPNGSGKTTIAYTLLKNSDVLSEYVRINPDDILREMGLPGNRENNIKAVKEAERITNEALAKGDPIYMETVFSSPEKMDMYNCFKEAGYTINMVYVSTESPDINVLNVSERVKKGGHDVPIDKIHSRYHKSMENIRTIGGELDCLILIDNSYLNDSPVIFSAHSSGKLCYLDETYERPVWINRILSGLSNKIEPDTEKKEMCDLIQSVLNDHFLENTEKFVSLSDRVMADPQIQLKAINAELEHIGLSLVLKDGFYCFEGKDVGGSENTCTDITNLNDLTPEEWLEKGAMIKMLADSKIKA